MNETKITEKEFVSLHGFRLLVAEDDLLNRQLITAMLKDGGAEVITAESGKQAIEKFCCIILTEVNGYSDA